MISPSTSATRRLFLLASAVLLVHLPAQAQTAPAAMTAKPAAMTARPPAASATRAKTAASGCTVKGVDYKGWKAEELGNQWIKVEIVPEFGGRIMQVIFDGHDLLYNNPKSAGQLPGPGKRVGNPGGSKIWPLPEGGQDEQHWSGGGGHLDAGSYTLKVLSATPNKCSVRLTGPVNLEIGQRYIEDVTIGPDTPIISYHIVMENVSGYPQTWSEQTVTEYALSEPNGSENLDKNWYGVTEINPNSAYPVESPDNPRHVDDCVKPTDTHPLSFYPKYYHVRSGPDVNDAYQIKDGTLRVHWNDVMQEVWVDTPSGWLAAVNGDTGYTVVERHAIDPNHEYPGKAAIIFYSSGEPCAARGGRGPGNREGPYVEAEVNSPMVTLNPGESYAMNIDWYPTRMNQDFIKPTSAGVIGQQLKADRAPNGVKLTGEFGVFYKGTLVAHIYPRTQEDNTVKVIDVKPTEEVHLDQTIQTPPNVSRISIHLVDDKGVDRGPLGEVRVEPPLAGGQGRRRQQPPPSQQPQQ